MADTNLPLIDRQIPLEEFEAFLATVDFKNTFWGVHYLRYLHTFLAINYIDFSSTTDLKALELGTSWIFPTYFRHKGIINNFDVADFNKDVDKKSYTRACPWGLYKDQSYQVYNINLENDPIPAADSSYDLIICFELLEHLDVDPMFMMAEINRVLKPGGRLVLSTPNSTSSQLVGKILQGYAPQMYMYYQRDRSPYRHNFEYAPHQLRQLMEASGLAVDKFWTVDSMSPPNTEAIEILKLLNLPITERGDNSFVIASKTGPVLDRYPDQIYDSQFKI